MSPVMDPRRWEAIQAAFDELVALDETSRASRLVALGSTDPALRAAVESLLAADAEASGRLAPLEAGLLGEAGTAPDPLGLAGRTISHFEVGELLGAGGMGMVYRAQDTRLNRAVALKFLLPHYSLDPVAKTRFLREAHAAAALDHVNLCTIYEVGESHDGRLFLAMALYEGETLKARLARKGPLPVANALDIARQIAQGLACAHAAGIVHRDLKPGNVLLLPDGTVKILDFGLAKARDQSVSDSGARLGTVPYMAPEQIRGEAVDARADLWALGVVLYEMLTDRKPFGGEQDIAVANAILRDEPVLPSTHRAEVPIAAEDLVQRLLQKDPRRRYDSATELLSVIARVATLDAEPLHSLRRHVRRARRLLLQKRQLLWAAGAVLVIGATSYTALARKSPSPVVADRTAIAVLPFRNLSTDSVHAYVAGVLHEEILGQLSRIAALKIINRTSVIGYASPNTPPLRKIATELGVRSVVQGSVQVVGGRLRVNLEMIDAATGGRVWAGNYDRTMDDAFAVQSDVAQQIVTSVGAQLTSAESQRVAETPTSSKEAYLYYLQGLHYLRLGPWGAGNLESAEQLLTRALALDTGFALAHAALSEMHRQMYYYRYDMTPARLGRQRAEAEAALRLAPDLPRAHLAMALVHQGGPRNNYRRGLQELRIALRGAPNDAETWQWLAIAHRHLGSWDSSLAAFNKAQELSPRDQFLILNHGNWTNTKLGRFQETIRWLDHARSLWPDLYVAPIGKGWNYAAWQGQLDTLRAAMSGAPGQEALKQGPVVLLFEFLRTTRQPDSLLRLLNMANLPWIGPDRVIQHPFHFIPLSLYAAWAHEMRADRPAALAAFDSALVVLDSAVRVVPNDWPVHQARGMALAGLGRRQEALQEVRWLRESVVYREDAFFGPTVRLAIAEVLAHSGEANAAVDELDHVLSEGAFGNILQVGTTAHSLRLNPTWDPIRQHPRFKALIAKYTRSSARGELPRPAAYERTAIAVLPFQNLSAQGRHAYFAGGLHDEILTQLSKVATLRVISRTSVNRYAGPNLPPLRQIANELGVGSVVEASVQVVGDRLRVNVTLVDAANDVPLWAELYDRTLGDAFAIQSEVAQRIVAAVGAAVTGTEQRRLADAPTANAEAYLLYLQAQDLGRPATTRRDYEIAQRLYEEALARDPNFALARAKLSFVHGWFYWARFDPALTRAARQREEAEAALRLAPDLPEAHVAMGFAHYWGRRDYHRALDEFSIALGGLPNDEQPWLGIAAVQRRLGNWDEVLEAYEKIARLAPLDADLLYDLAGGTYRITRRYAEAVRAFDRALSIAPDADHAAIWRGQTYVMWQRRLDTLRAVVSRLPRDAEPGPQGTRTSLHAQLLLWERNADSLLRAINGANVFEGIDFYLPARLYAAWAHQLRGDERAALSAFDLARVQTDSVLRELPDDWRVHAARGLALAGLGRREEALREAHWLEQSAVYRGDAFTGPLVAEARARILAQAREPEPALDEIERLLKDPSLVTVHTLRLDPLWDPIRQHPRFQALLAQYGRRVS